MKDRGVFVGLTCYAVVWGTTGEDVVNAKVIPLQADLGELAEEVISSLTDSWLSGDLFICASSFEYNEYSIST